MFFMTFLLFSLFLAVVTVIPAKALLLVEGRVKLTLPRVPSIRGFGLLFAHIPYPSTSRELLRSRATRASCNMRSRQNRNTKRERKEEAHA